MARYGELRFNDAPADLAAIAHMGYGRRASSLSASVADDNSPIRELTSRLFALKNSAMTNGYVPYRTDPL